MSRVDYEINLNRRFCEYVSPKPLEEMKADIRKMEKEIVEMMGDFTETGGG